MQTTPHLLVWDFDGVLIESIDEVIVNSYNTATGDLLTTLRDLPPGFEKKFRQHAHLGQTPARFVLLAQWCLGLAGPRTETITFAEIESLRKTEIADPHACAISFYEKRGILARTNRAAWLALHRPFQPLWAALIPSAAETIIVSHKNKEAICDLCRHFGLHVREENVFAGDAGTSKMAHFSKLKSMRPVERISFVDDSVHNLRDLQAALPELRLFLASWGTVGPEDAGVAKALGIEAIRQEEAVRLFKERDTDAAPTR